MRQQEQQQRERCCPLSHGASQSAHAAICRDMLPCVLDSDMHVLSCASLGAVLQRGATNQEPHLREEHYTWLTPHRRQILERKVNARSRVAFSFHEFSITTTRIPSDKA